MNASTFTTIFLVALTLAVATQLWLAQRQLRSVLGHRNRVPDAFAGSISLEAHQKAADYTAARVRFSRIDILWSALLLLGWTLGGGLQWLDDFWNRPNLGYIGSGTAVILSVMLLSSLLEMPLSAWRTFVIEQRFGFNRMTPVLFAKDLLKGSLLTLVIGGPLAALVLWIMDSSGDLWWLYVWIVWVLFSLLMMWAWPTLIAPLFNRFQPLEDNALRQRIEALLDKCGFHSKGIFVMDGSTRSAHGNAYFSGLGNNKRIVFYDTLIEQLDADEIEAVLAHELGHFRLRHIRKRMIWMSLISLAALALLGWLSGQGWFYLGLGVERPSPHMALLLFVMLSPVFGYFLTPLMSWLSRKHEFEADDYAARQSDATLLVRALVKMYEENASTLTPDELYSAFYDSHPPAPIRIRHLQRLAGHGMEAHA